MIYLELLFSFFKIGIFTFGGGFAMLPLITDEITAHGWMDPGLMVDFVAVSESTPGPFAINIATFVGAKAGGFLGALCATAGVVAPSLAVIYVIAAFFKNLTDKQVVKDVFKGLRPAVVGLIAYAAVTIAAGSVFAGVDIFNPSTYRNTDFTGLIIFAIILCISLIRIKKRSLHPILLILVSAGLGMLCYGVILPLIPV